MSVRENGFWFQKVALRLKKKKTCTVDKIFGGKDNKHRKEFLSLGGGERNSWESIVSTSKISLWVTWKKAQTEAWAVWGLGIEKCFLDSQESPGKLSRPQRRTRYMVVPAEGPLGRLVEFFMPQWDIQLLSLCLRRCQRNGGCFWNLKGSCNQGNGCLSKYQRM